MNLQAQPAQPLVTAPAVCRAESARRVPGVNILWPLDTGSGSRGKWPGLQG